MSAYTEFFLNSPASTVQLELIEISHPSFSQTYRIVRNAVNGVTVTLEDSSVVTFDYYPLQIEAGNTRETLDQSFTITLGDTGDILPAELDAVATADTFNIRPTIKYRTYRSDDLSTPLFGPLLLEVENFAFDRTGVSFSAKAPSLNVNSTGERYLLDRFPMLRGFL